MGLLQNFKHNNSEVKGSALGNRSDGFIQKWFTKRGLMGKDMKENIIASVTCKVRLELKFGNYSL